jgi:hypothetical protein
MEGRASLRLKTTLDGSRTVRTPKRSAGTSILSVGLCIVFSLFASHVEASYAEFWVPDEIAKRILKDRRVIDYFHLELDQVEPIFICSGMVSPEFNTVDLGYSFRLVADDSPECETAFRFTRLETDDKRAYVMFEYPPEGLRGEYVFRRWVGRWWLKERKIWES